MSPSLSRKKSIKMIAVMWVCYFIAFGPAAYFLFNRPVDSSLIDGGIIATIMTAVIFGIVYLFNNYYVRKLMN